MNIIKRMAWRQEVDYQCTLIEVCVHRYLTDPGAYLEFNDRLEYYQYRWHCYYDSTKETYLLIQREHTLKSTIRILKCLLTKPVRYMLVRYWRNKYLHS